jgi:chorismate synthase
MSANIFGERFKVASFGESHGPAYGVVIDGMPAGVTYQSELLLKNLAARRPGQAHTTSRQEPDQPEILSGLFENKTLGTPIAVIVRNENQNRRTMIKLNRILASVMRTIHGKINSPCGSSGRRTFFGPRNSKSRDCRFVRADADDSNEF